MNRYDVSKALEEIQERLTYKPGQTFSLRIGGDYGPDQIFGTQSMTIVDADDPSSTIDPHQHTFNLETVAHYCELAGHDLDLLFHAILDDLLVQVIDFERHEALEFFRIDGECHRPPTHPPGHGEA
jgi:hypothetical protein